MQRTVRHPTTQRAGPGRARPNGGFGLLLVEVSRLWRQRLDERLRPLGLSQAKWVALYRLARLPAPPTQAALAAELGVEGPTVARLLSRLEAAGYIERRAAPGDRRLKVVHLTARARAEAARINRIAGDLRGELMAGLDADELGAAWRIVLELRDRLDPPPAAAGGKAPRDRR